MTEELDTNGLQVVPDDGKINPTLSVESRPSNIEGFNFYLVLRYKDHFWEALLPRDFMAKDELEQNLLILPLAEQMRLELKPILEAEDAQA